MAEPVLQRPRIMPCIRQSVAAGMPEHVAVNREGKAGTLANALDQPINGVGRERAAPLGREDEATVGKLPAQLPECPNRRKRDWDVISAVFFSCPSEHVGNNREEQTKCAKGAARLPLKTIDHRAADAAKA